MVEMNISRIRKALENRTNMEDDRVSILEAQLNQAKLIAEEADKKYEEVLNSFSILSQFGDGCTTAFKKTFITFFKFSMF